MFSSAGGDATISERAITVFPMNKRPYHTVSNYDRKAKSSNRTVTQHVDTKLYPDKCTYLGPSLLTTKEQCNNIVRYKYPIEQ